MDVKNQYYPFGLFENHFVASQADISRIKNRNIFKAIDFG